MLQLYAYFGQEGVFLRVNGYCVGLLNGSVGGWSEELDFGLHLGVLVGLLIEGLFLLLRTALVGPPRRLLDLIDNRVVEFKTLLA